MDTVHYFGVCLFVILVSVINGYSQTTVRGVYFFLFQDFLQHSELINLHAIPVRGF